MTRKIMLIEDDQPILELMEILLQRLGYEPVLAPNVGDALRQIRTDPPALVLLDLMMTPMNGWEVLETIREDYRIMDLPIILFTASPSAEERIAQMGDPRLGVLQKPVSINELKAGIEKFLGP